MSNLRAQSISKTYPMGHDCVGVFSNISWEFRAGALTAIQGASGAGKTTLLHVLAGLQKPDLGQISFDGQDIYALPGSGLARMRNQKFGFIFQSYHLLPELTALENAALPSMIAGKPDFAAATTLLERVGLGHRMSHLPGQLSGGEQQRVAIARALACKPEILFADEPTGNLDSHTGGAILSVIRELQQERGLTTVLVTHDSRVAAVADVRLRLEDGELSESVS